MGTDSPTNEPRTRSHRIETPRTTLILLPAEFHRAALAGETDLAEKIVGASLPGGWPDEDDRFMLDMRLKDLSDHPEWAHWWVRAIVERSSSKMVGHVGFHGPPDNDGLVEVGYTIFEQHRRKGFAEEAVRALLAWALADEDVVGFRASVGPWNEPSLKMVEKLGFVQVGVQWDERDGQELVFELRPLPEQ